MTDILRRNINEMIERMGVMPDPYRPHVSSAMLEAENLASSGITEALLVRYGEELFPDQSRYMVGPIKSAPDGSVVEPKTFQFKTQYRPFQYATCWYTSKVKDDILDWICEELRDELWEEIEIMALRGKVMYPYLPVIAVSKTDPATLEPYFVFVSRFGSGSP